MRRMILPFAGALLALSGCNMAPKYERPAEALPGSLGAQAAPAQDLQSWWELFGDARLNALVERSMAENTSVLSAAARVRQARAALGMSNADKWPGLTGSGAAQRKETPQFQLQPGATDPANAFSLSAMLSYEVDLFGRVANASAAARDDLAASSYAVESVRASIAAETVVTYYNLVAAREQLHITQRSVETRRNTLKIQQDRYAAGYGSEAERLQAEAELANAEVTIPDLLQRVESLKSALRILTGATPEEIWTAADIADTPAVLPQPPAVSLAVLPASLLERRPDVAAAEAQYRASVARIGVAKAQRWPTLSLGAVLGSSDNEIGDLFSAASRTWTLSGSLSGPIYDFGRSAGRIESAEAAAEIAELNYIAVVRSAFKELRDAQTSAELSAQSVEARIQQAAAWDRYLAISTERYKTGYADPLELLDAERGQMAAHLALVNARLNRVVAAANLCKALGGGWTPGADKK